MTMKFGRRQLSNPTPASINFWVRVYTIVAGAFIGWMQTAPYIGIKTQAMLSSIIGLTLGIANGLAPLFGTEVPANVPAKEVTAVEEKIETKP